MGVGPFSVVTNTFGLSFGRKVLSILFFNLYYKICNNTYLKFCLYILFDRKKFSFSELIYCQINCI